MAAHISHGRTLGSIQLESISVKDGDVLIIPLKATVDVVTLITAVNLEISKGGRVFVKENLLRLIEKAKLTLSKVLEESKKNKTLEIVLMVDIPLQSKIRFSFKESSVISSIETTLK